MRVVVQNTLTNRQWIGFDSPAGFTVGRDSSCEIKLDSRFVSAQHVKVERSEVGWEIELFPGVNPVEVNGTEIAAGQKVQFKNQAQLKIMEFVLTMEDAAEISEAGKGDEQLTDLLNVLHANVLRRLDLRLGALTSTSISQVIADQLNKIIDDLLLNDFRREVFESDLTPVLARIALRSRANDWVIRKMTQEKLIAAEWHGIGENTELEGPLEQAILKVVNKAGIYTGKAIPANAEELVEATFKLAADGVLGELLETVRTYLVISFIKKTLYDIIFGLGPLEDLLRSPSITEIMVVHPRLIYIERNGRVSRIPQVFPSEEACLSVIERIVSPLGRRIDRSQPLVDARLRDGSRVNAIIEPLALSGPCITIRKFPQYRVSVDDLIKWKSITNPAVALLKACVQFRANILVSGGTGSGKTTLLNVLSGFIPHHERLVTIEDSAELRMQQEHVVSLETKPANAEGAGRYTTRDLVRNALRMRPDRIIVGECRGDEAVDMLQAMNTGHSGSMTTIHANSTADSVARLETMVLMGAEIPLPAVRRQIASAIHLIVQLDRQPSGQRMVSQVSEVIGLHPTTGEVETRDIMKLTHLPNNQLALKPTGYMPRFLGEMVEKGHLKLESWFEQVKTA
ncbi:MAG: Flp pilus assembly complex ATPase component TadA [Phycisphaerales bacterium]|nr:Flp pilus assembly complex ATPase component TadA [Phycisphaerales bacterium]